MWSCQTHHHGTSALCLLILLLGCSSPEPSSYPLDQALARQSLERAMQAWLDGRQPQDLKPDVIVGDPAWEQGKKLVSYDILIDQETTDGSNLHIPVVRVFETSQSTMTYIVGTDPVITVFAQ